MIGCLNEQTLQAYFDDELAPADVTRIVKHLAKCDACADAAFELRRAIQLMGSAIDDELPDSIPTEHLRARIAAVVAEQLTSAEKDRQASGLRRKLDARVRWPQPSPRQVAYACVAVLVLVCALWLGMRTGLFSQREDNRATDTTVPAPAPKDQQQPDSIRRETAGGGTPSKIDTSRDKAIATSEGPLQSGPGRKRHPRPTGEDPTASQRNVRDEFAEGLAGAGDVSVQFDASIFNAGTIRHFERAQMLLRSFRNSDPQTPEFAADLGREKRQSKSLLYQNILLRRDAETTGNLPAEEVLGSLEPILLDISNLADQPSPDEVRSIKERMHKREIIGVLQVYSAPWVAAGYRNY